jgi:hypothetical protein
MIVEHSLHCRGHICLPAGQGEQSKEKGKKREKKEGKKNQQAKCPNL